MMLSFFKRSVFALRWLGWALFAVVMSFCLLLLLLRYWLLPDIERYRPHIAAAISQVAGQQISIERIDANWDGLRPYLQLHGVRVHDRYGSLVLILTELDGTFAWRSLLYGELRFRAIRIERPVLIVRRDLDGVLHIAGGVFDQDEADTGFFDWLLRQRQLTINNADVFWLDELRAAPVLYLNAVSLLMRNQDGVHRFGLRATPPAEVAAPIDIRGEFTGVSVSAKDRWRGRLFAQLDHVDLAVLQTWLPFPNSLQFDHGSGAFRAWIGVDSESVTGWTADMNFNETRLHWAGSSPKLDLGHVRGRVGWKKYDDGEQSGDEWFVQQLSVAIQDRRFIKPMNITWQRKAGGETDSLENTLRIDDLDVSALTSLAHHLPIASAMQQQIARWSPQGVIDHAQLAWQGDWQAPRVFDGKVSFRKLAVNQLGKIAAVSGISGSVEMTEQNGALSLDSDKVSVTWSGAAGESIEFDHVAALIDWQQFSDLALTVFELHRVSFANNYIAGTMHGRYQDRSGQSGAIALGGELTYAEAGYLSRYLTRLVNQEKPPSWLANSAITGWLDDFQFYVRGDVNQLFAGQRQSQVVKFSTKITDATVKLPDGWPAMTGVRAAVSLEDRRLKMTVHQAKAGEIALTNARLQIENIAAPDPVLRVSGVAEGATQHIIDLVEKVPLSGRAATGFSSLGKVSGNGKLQWEATWPLGPPQAGRALDLQGRYELIDNEIDLEDGFASLSKLNGTLAFTQSTVSIAGLKGQALGGPMTVDVTTLPGGELRIAAAGRVDFDRLHALNPGKPTTPLQLWLQFLRGATDWSAVFDMSEKGVGVKLESTLAGAVSSLPGPFSKSAAERVPFSFVRNLTDLNQEVLQFRVGDIMTAEIRRTLDEDGHFIPVRGVMSFQTAPEELPVAVMTKVHGAISSLEWDRWQALFRRHDEMVALSGRQGRGVKALLTDRIVFDLDIGRLDFLESRFNAFSFRADKQGFLWDATVVSAEVVGKIAWDGGVKRKAVARLKKLAMPEAVPDPHMTEEKRNQPKNWPTVDLQAEALFAKEKPLGELILLAQQQRDGWHIDSLRVTHADSAFSMQGVWQNQRAPFQMQAEIRLQANNIGKFLTRVGYPGRIARGEGKLEGSLTWQGEPFSLHFPSLSGKLRVAAQRGQFTKFRPGMSKLLGIFDLKSIPRRLTLDFYDVFSQGFGFEDILGDVKIENGVAETHELQIAGSAAYLAVSGEINLVEETQSLLVKMFPSLGLATPVVGIASMIANQSLKDPFDRVLFNEYAITGTWDEPVVVKSQSAPESKE